MSERYLEIVEIASGEVVHRVDVSSKSDRALDRVFEGLLMKTNTERFFIRDLLMKELA